MNISLGQVWMGKPLLQRLYQFKDQFNVKTNTKLGINLFLINNYYNIIEQSRLSLIKKYGVLINDKIEVPDETIQNFREDFADILKQEINLDLLPFKLSELKEVKELTFTPIETYNFKFLLSDFEVIKLSKVETSYGKLIDSQQLVDKLRDKSFNIDLSAKLFIIFQTVNIIFTEIVDFRKNLAQTYNVLNWNQQDAPERIITFNKELNNYLTETRPINIPIINIEELEFLKLDPTELNLLSYLFDLTTL